MLKITIRRQKDDGRHVMIAGPEIGVEWFISRYGNCDPGYTVCQVPEPVAVRDFPILYRDEEVTC